MEGSRHERVALIGATYVTGFVTAFIAFGVTQFEDTMPFVYVPTETQSAALVLSAEQKNATSLVLMSDGLYYKTGEEEVLISSVAEADGVDGVAAAIVQYELSPDGAWAYFCEQPITEIDGCKPFVYSTKAGIVVPLLQAGERIALPNVVAALLWDENGLAAIGDIALDPLPSL